jgi:hypothetical protein
VQLACNQHLPPELIALVSTFHNQQLVVKTYRQIIHEWGRNNLLQGYHSKVRQYVIVSVASDSARPVVADIVQYCWYSDEPHHINAQHYYYLQSLTKLRNDSFYWHYVVNDFSDVASALVPRPTPIVEPRSCKRRAVGH